MKKEIKDLWVRALRSGELEQIKGYLEKDGAYCALGVLSVLALVEGQCTYNDLGDGGRFDNKRFSLSYNTCAWAGIELENEQVSFKVKGKVRSIAGLNDRGLTFHELADLIEVIWKEI